LKSPKQKGDAYEREVAAYLNAAVFGGRNQVFRRPLSGGGRTFSGSGESDLEGLPGLWAECKRTERFNIHEAMAQALRGSVAHGCGEIPIIFNRRNNTPTGQSLVTLHLEGIVHLLRAWYKERGQL
jgi:hypothetical protein